MNKSAESYQKAANRLGKWRVLLAGWILGTRSDEDPQAAGVRDLQEARLMMRAELNVVLKILVDKGVIRQETLLRLLADECEQCCADLEKRFPGVRATDQGLVIDERAVETFKNLGFPP